MKTSMICVLVLFYSSLIDAQTNLIHSTVNLSISGYEFQPANLIELLTTFTTQSLLRCGEACNLHIQCRTFDYDTSSRVCRLFEGAYITGNISLSTATSRVGAVRLSPDLFTSFGQPCSQCTRSRYLICLNSLCQCPPNSFWNGIRCENQRYNGASCYNDQWCRNDTLGLACSAYNICFATNNTMVSTVSTTLTSTTTTVTPNCNSTCVNDTTVWSQSVLARWTFENSYEDSTLLYNGTAVNSPVFVAGYVGQALSIDSSLDQYVSTAFIPLDSRSFTIDVWIYPTSYPNPKGSHSIVGLCPQQASLQCLQVILRSNLTSTTSTGIFNFWQNPYLTGLTPIPINRWTHLAFIYSKSTKKQILYVNGIYDNSRTPSNGSAASSGEFYIGNNPNLTSDPSIGKNNFQGYIDQLTISAGIRSVCELLNVATLAARFTFDNNSDFLADSGPNAVSVNASNYTIVNGVRGNQAISFTAQSSSYFQASGFRFLSYNGTALSLALWIQPSLLQGSIISSSVGYSFLAFASNGSLIARIGSTSVEYNNLLQVGSIWTHIVQTWSSLNGIQLYINNQLVANDPTAALIGSGKVTNTLTLGGGTYAGAIDEWRIYSRELTAQDVCALFTT